MVHPGTNISACHTEDTEQKNVIKIEVWKKTGAPTYASVQMSDFLPWWHDMLVKSKSKNLVLCVLPFPSSCLWDSVKRNYTINETKVLCTSGGPYGSKNTVWIKLGISVTDCIVFLVQQNIKIECCLHLFKKNTFAH